MSYEDLESLEETLEILSDHGLAQAIRESLSDQERFSINDIRRDLEARSSGGGAEG
jgi:antitoxin YefM